MAALAPTWRKLATTSSMPIPPQPWSLKVKQLSITVTADTRILKAHHDMALVENAKAKSVNFNVSDAENGLYKWSSLRSQYLAEANNQIAGEYGGEPGFYPGWYWDPYMWDYTFLGGGPVLEPLWIWLLSARMGWRLLRRRLLWRTWLLRRTRHRRARLLRRLPRRRWCIPRWWWRRIPWRRWRWRVPWWRWRRTPLNPRPGLLAEHLRCTTLSPSFLRKGGMPTNPHSAL